MAAQESSTPPPKVLFIIGPTGVGKSRLALDICLKLREEGINAEIVSADSMQVYKGCDIATAKATAAERQAVPHHLLDVCTPQEAFSAADYLKAAKQTIQTLSEEGKLPVVVGGTQLYIQLLLWQSAVDLSLQKQNTNQTNANKIREALEAKTNEELVEILRQIDIKRAQQLHPHDRRRIIRSIELTQEFGVPHSEVMKGENKDNLRHVFILGIWPQYSLFTTDIMSMQYDACIFWLDLRDREALEKRLRQRLEKMCQEGLLDEVRWVAEQLQLRSWPPETTGGPRGPIEWPDSPSEGATLGEGRHPSPTWSDSCNPEAHETKKREGLRGGVLQGIGYKEFFPLVLPGANRGAVSDASPSGHSSELFSESLKACLELVVLRSLQYARQQRKWIRNKFLIRRKNVPLYFFETTDGLRISGLELRACGIGLRALSPDFLAGKSFSEDLEFAAAKQMPEVLKLRENTSENDEDAHHGRG
ncbi:tRNA delta(2)-isopentenylpyrophosphate transferase, putative [Eimeria maxima]|uniref:tRNA delta(2)-isopentenylpyrophosphate transferase, putative n=1 Tax=Eimeria maxima TaxID=5804 RepID=U6ME85_EIMMA|nr:tRNA delta(2)-isopentenylpyrophosphate transferase, putative [Eimeria maxima]CDJ61373.1 tRNA delta(2)-isopentenylpyrophosphate transferase, putative [Eimeria maxima]